MKLSFLLLALALSQVADAQVSTCPELAGSYVCHAKDQEVSLEVSQSVLEGVTIYKDGSDEYRTDGVTYALDWGFFKGFYRSTCVNDSWFLWVKGEVFTDTGKLGDVEDRSTYQLNSAGDVVWNYVYRRVESSGTVINLSEQVLCNRQKPQSAQHLRGLQPSIEMNVSLKAPVFRVNTPEPSLTIGPGARTPSPIN